MPIHGHCLAGSSGQTKPSTKPQRESSSKKHQSLPRAGSHYSRTNVVTIGYLAVTPNLANPTAGSDAAEAQLWSVDDVLNGKVATAFDHTKIITDAVTRTRSDLEQTDLALSFVGKTFTVRELQTVFEAIWGATLEPANFRRSLLASTKFIVETKTVNASGKTGGRPALRYKATKAWRDGSPIRRRQTR